MKSDVMLTASEARQVTFSRGIRYIKEQVFRACCSDTCETQIVIPLDKESKMYDLLGGYTISHQDKTRLDDKLKALLVTLTEFGYFAGVKFTTITNGGEYYNATYYNVSELIISWGNIDAYETAFL